MLISCWILATMPYCSMLAADGDGVWGGAIQGGIIGGAIGAVVGGIMYAVKRKTPPKK